ncbi:ABC transporter permease [Candidatus Poriferisocius sp.]|uniref:ABC transporter permease n=1 Tax=Candidatus Poriferisocius sp. TaxID=3101276 RepID=UPI003B5C8676
MTGLLATSWYEEKWLNNWEIPFGKWVEEAINWLNVEAELFFAIIKWPFEHLLDLITNDVLLQIPWPFMLLLFIVVGTLTREFKVGVAAAAGILLSGVLGPDYWRFTMQTIGIILVSVIICVIVGLPYGVLCARSNRVWNLTRPVLDGMQLIHPFTYLIPIIFFFGTGPVGGTVATMVFALPPMIRLTYLGIRQVPEDVVEAARSYGASGLRVLTDVQLPLARPAIMTGINQTLLLSLSMVGIIAVIAGGGLGQLVLRGINTFDAALGASSGLALYLVGVAMDRLSQPDPKDNRALIRRMSAAMRGVYTVPPPLSGEATGEPVEPVVVESPGFKSPAIAARSLAGAALGIVGGLLVVSSMFFSWVDGAGRLSGFARLGGQAPESFSDLDADQLDELKSLCRPEARSAGCWYDDRLLDGSFNGYEASGGSWFGIFVFALGVAAVLASALVLAGSRDRWLRWLSAPLGQVVSGGAVVATVVLFLLTTPPKISITTEAGPELVSVATNHGVGIWIALGGGLLLFFSGLLAHGMGFDRRYGNYRAGPALLSLVAIGLLVMAAFSNWINDERPGALTPQQEQMVAEERANPSAESASIVAQIIGQARGGPKHYSGFDELGPGFGRGMVVLSVIIGVVVLFMYLLPWAIALFDAMLLALGLAALLSVGAWVLGFLRVADNGIYTGFGALPALAGGALIVATVIGRMYQRYLDDREAADAAIVV